MSELRSVVTDADLKLNEKMATVCGVFLCKATRRNPVLYRAFRHSLRSGNWRVRSAYRMSKNIYEINKVLIEEQLKR